MRNARGYLRDAQSPRHRAGSRRQAFGRLQALPRTPQQPREVRLYTLGLSANHLLEVLRLPAVADDEVRSAPRAREHRGWPSATAHCRNTLRSSALRMESSSTCSARLSVRTRVHTGATRLATSEVVRATIATTPESPVKPDRHHANARAPTAMTALPVTNAATRVRLRRPRPSTMAMTLAANERSSSVFASPSGSRSITSRSASICRVRRLSAFKCCHWLSSATRTAAAAPMAAR